MVAPHAVWQINSEKLPNRFLPFETALSRHEFAFGHLVVAQQRLFAGLVRQRLGPKRRIRNVPDTLGQQPSDSPRLPGGGGPLPARNESGAAGADQTVSSPPVQVRWFHCGVPREQSRPSARSLVAGSDCRGTDRHSAKPARSGAGSVDRHLPGHHSQPLVAGLCQFDRRLPGRRRSFRRDSRPAVPRELHHLAGFLQYALGYFQRAAGRRRPRGQRGATVGRSPL